MPTENLYDLTRLAMREGSASLSEQRLSGEDAPLAGLINQLLQENQTLRRDHQRAVEYIRAKIDQLLVVIGTVPLRAEELTEEHLISLDPLGIVAQSFGRILEHSRETNRKLALARDEIHAIFQSVGGSLLVLDEQHRILAYNNNFRNSFSPDQEEIIGKACHEIICKQDSPPAGFCVLKKMLATDQGCTISPWPFADKHLRVAATPIKDSSGATIRTVVLYVDITELIETRSALAAEKERLTTTLESIAEGVIATDSTGQVTMMNRMAEKLTGWDANHAIGKSVCEVLMIENLDAPASCGDFFRDIIQHQIQTERLECTKLTALNGNELSIYLSAAPIRQADQSVTGAIIVFRDITGDLQVKEELAKAAKLESIGLFAGGIAHDFNNLLTAILGNVSLARAQISPNDNAYQLLNATEKSVNRAKGLTQQLLTFARGGAPVTSLTSSRDLIMDSARFPLSGTNARIDFAIPDDLWPIEVDAGQISQVIQNLVINAAQAMPDGGLIRIAVENLQITADTMLPLPAGKYLKIAVVDQGPGISSENLAHIFEPFYTTKSSGQGLGLTICYSIIKQHQGLITVESSPSTGTTFTIYLPASELRIEESEEAEMSVVKTGRVLVMDDDEMILNVVRAMLEFSGYEVVEAGDGEAAISAYKQAMERGQRFDAVLIDLTIRGGMGGKEAIARLRSLDPGIRAIVSSGYASDPIMSDYRSYGFCGVIPKPYRTQELTAAISAAISGNNQAC
ncbi:MAG: PAS domain S-box protein [Desulfobulbaceae bacterium]|nr:PAS domain S-box protein [Desulfobulbaceae bacterium]